ncbi:MAG: ATP-grasp domain-containing protein [Planctomycetes bacterium]|nr:ATP-grasp domain-containing protein [Planctomycetota bacterium]
MKLFLYESVSAGGLGEQAALSLRTEGWAMLTALVEDFLRVKNLEIHTLLSESAPRSLGHVCRRTSPRQELQAFLDIVAKCDAVLVVAPECGGLLEQRSRQVVAANKMLLSSSPEGIALAADKTATAHLWNANGVPTPDLLELDSATFPAVSKPRHGAGSQAVFRISAADEKERCLAQARREMPTDDIVLQEYVHGLAASIAFLVGPKQTLPLLAGRQILSDDGRFRYEGGVLPLPEPSASGALRLGKHAIASVPGLRGFVGIDLVLGEDADWAIEINPRLTTSYLGLRQLARPNLAEIWLSLVRGRLVDPPKWREASVQFGPDGVCRRRAIQRIPRPATPPDESVRFIQ